MKKAISVFLHLFLHLVFFFNIYFCINMLVEVWSDGKLAGGFFKTSTSISTSALSWNKSFINVPWWNWRKSPSALFSKSFASYLKSPAMSHTKLSITLSSVYHISIAAISALKAVIDGRSRSTSPASDWGRTAHLINIRTRKYINK